MDKERHTNIGARIALARGQHSQKAFAEIIGVHKNTLSRYERGENLPDAAVLLAMRDIGVNSEWVLTGEGPMMLADLKPEPAPGAFNPELMRQVIEAVEVALDQLGREMDPEDKASLVLSLYDLYSDSAVAPDRSKIIKLVKSAA